MGYSESTTWTIGRILDRLHETGEEVVVFAGHHAHRGVIRAVGEYLLTLQSADDVIAVSLASVSSVQLLGGALALPEQVLDLADEPEEPVVVVAEPVDPEPDLFSEPVTVVEVSDVVDAPAPVVSMPSEDDERIAAETARRTEELQDWLRQLRES